MHTHQCTQGHAYTMPDEEQCPVCGGDLEPTPFYRQYEQIIWRYTDRDIVLMADGDNVNTSRYVTFGSDPEVVKDHAESWPMRVLDLGIARLIVDLQKAGYRVIVTQRIK